METTTERLELERELAIAARPETVWGLLVDPEGLSAGWAMTATLDPRPGGEVRIEVILGQRRERRGGRGRPAAAARLHLGLGGGRRTGPELSRPARRTVEFELAPDGDGHAAPASSTATCRTRRRSSRTAHGWDHYLPRARAAVGPRPATRGATRRARGRPVRRDSTRPQGEVTMAKYVSVYKGGADGADATRSGSALMAAWGQWLGDLGGEPGRRRQPLRPVGGGEGGRLERRRHSGPHGLLDPRGAEASPRRRGRRSGCPVLAGRRLGRGLRDLRGDVGRARGPGLEPGPRETSAWRREDRRRARRPFAGTRALDLADDRRARDRGRKKTSPLRGAPPTSRS